MQVIQMSVQVSFAADRVESSPHPLAVPIVLEVGGHRPGHRGQAVLGVVTEGVILRDTAFININLVILASKSPENKLKSIFLQ